MNYYDDLCPIILKTINLYSQSVYLYVRRRIACLSFISKLLSNYVDCPDVLSLINVLCFTVGWSVYAFLYCCSFTTISSHTSMHDIGFLFSSNLFPNLRIQEICCRAFKILGFICCISFEFKLSF